MDRERQIFWKRLSFIVLVSLILGLVVANYYNWMFGLIAYITVQWFSLPVLFRMSMND